MLCVLLVVMALFGFVLMETDFDNVAIITMTFTLFILVSFTSLKVTIDENYLRIKFGYGIFQKKFLLSDIDSAKAVKNCWCCGWGIRWCPSMWIYNVSGFDAVEIITKSGKVYRIGTDEPKKLESAVKKSI